LHKRNNAKLGIISPFHQGSQVGEACVFGLVGCHVSLGGLVRG
jgi:hypothetical protein